jgi:hypothetical protein
MSLEQSILFVGSLLPIWREWSGLGSVHLVRFDEFKKDPVQEAVRLTQFLGLGLSESRIKQVGATYRAESLANNQATDHVHFSGGQVGGWREAFSDDILQLSEDVFSPFLAEMGYDSGNPKLVADSST